MATEFKNLIISDNTGEITTYTELSVWKCSSREWSTADKVVLRNILLAGYHPNPKERFCIGEIPETTNDANLLNPFKPEGGDRYYLDLASGSRTHGRFTFSLDPVGRFYYGEDWKRIIYGSIMHTGCKRLVYNKAISYVITDDEHRDEGGNLLDDPVNGKHWGTGDSHAKASGAFMAFMGVAPIELPDGQEVDTPVQFRVGKFKEWVGKGTVAHNPDMDDSGVDLAIPLSSLKGNKPMLGTHTGNLLFGIVFEAEQRRAKIGWMFMQWFSFETLQQDGIITKLEQRCQKLRDGYNDIQQLADVLRISQEEAEAELQENDTLQSEAEYENTMIRIIRADQNGILLLHPYVVRRVKERMQSLWLNLAKSAGVRFFSLMTQPDEYFRRYHVYQNGNIIGGKVFCAADFEEGEYIVFCNPMRHWGDVQLWRNKHEGLYTNSHGTMATSTELFLSLGRDFDGDFVQLIKSSAYPAISQAIKEFSDTPNVEKLPKVALTGSIQQIAINSMSDLTGVVASLLGRTRAANAENAVLMIPPGGEQTEPKEFRIIDFLSQELQIAVDSLKSAYPNNTKGLDTVKEYLDSIGAAAPWLKDFKDPLCYRDRPCLVDAESPDTVSRVVRLVNSYWRAPDLVVDSSPRNYETVLFGDVPHAPEQLEYALKHRADYRSAMGEAIAWKEENDDATRIREVAQATKLSKEKILNAINRSGETYSLQSWVSAYWKAAHQADTGDAGLVFMIFADEIVDKLKNAEATNIQVVEVYAVQYGKWASPQTAPWRGQQVIVRVNQQTVAGKQRLAIEMKWPDAKLQTTWESLGLVGDKSKAFLLPGQTKEMKIYSTAFKNGVTSSVKLFDLSMNQDDINDYLNFQ